MTTIDHALGPLVVSRSNPRYFAVYDASGTERAVYLTGSHIWNNFHDGLGPGRAAPGEPEQNDYGAYLSLLKQRNHNFIRLWRWEHFQSQAGAGSDVHMNMTPQPWPRTGPGVAKDGAPKFDLSNLNEAYFTRLRDRVVAAGAQHIYVAVMLFEGWGLHLSPAPDNIEGHPFFADNNVNGIGIQSIVDYQCLPLEDAVRTVQEAYIRAVIDTVHDLPNVLYEVANESVGGGRVDREFAEYLNLSGVPEWGDSTEWQYWVVNLVKRYQREKGYTHHPIGMTMQWPVKDQLKVNDPLYRGAAEWISPGFDDEVFASGGHPMTPDSPPSHWYSDPPAADGRKVIMSDTDHYAPGRGDALWAWKSFIRGHQPILMDYGITDLGPGRTRARDTSLYDLYEPARYAMGDTLRLARRIQLLEMAPQGELSSTKYALVSRGRQYVVLQPDAVTPFAVKLEPGTYNVEWYNVSERETRVSDPSVVDETAVTTFTPPFEQATAVVLYLNAA